jgi:putative NADH-flavin reductase
MMKLLIFGAAGGTGRHLVEQALGQGHDVTAFVRDPRKLKAARERLAAVQGDVMNAAAVERAMPGHDAVLCALGSPALKTGTVRSAGTRNIVSAMEKAGVQRLVCLSSLGCGDSRAVMNAAPFFSRYIVVPLLLRRVFAEHERQEECIRRSRLDWTIVRPGYLTDGPLTGVYRDGFAPTDTAIKISISRADVAAFMLKQLADDTYLRKAPGLSH